MLESERSNGSIFFYNFFLFLIFVQVKNKNKNVNGLLVFLGKKSAEQCE